MQSKAKTIVARKRTLLMYIFIGVFFTGLVLMFWKFPQGQTEPLTNRKFAYEFDNSKKAAEVHVESTHKVVEQIATASHKDILHSNKLDKPTIIQRNQVASNQLPPVPIAQTAQKPLGSDTMLLIICANRPEYLQRTLEAVAKYHPTDLPIFISQDGDDARVQKLIKGTFLHLQLSCPDTEFIHRQHISNEFYENGYFRLASHYKWALDQVFAIKGVERVIILEEDLLIAPDFFDLFAATAHILDTDEQLLAVSAWNDNGMQQSVRDNTQLFRSDFFPGLGWMLPKRVWTELGPRWPRAYWDDWLREPKQRQGRHIIRPEVCRTLHIGQKGVSNAQYSKYLTSIKLNDAAVPFTTMDLSYLQLAKWDEIYLNQVRAATLLSLDDARSGRGLLTAKRTGKMEVRVVYGQFEGSGNSFSRLAEWAGAMDNVKAGVPRTAYKGIVTVWKGEVRVHLVPVTFQ